MEKPKPSDFNLPYEQSEYNQAIQVYILALENEVGTYKKRCNYLEKQATNNELAISGLKASIAGSKLREIIDEK